MAQRWTHSMTTECMCSRSWDIRWPAVIYEWCSFDLEHYCHTPHGNRLRWRVGGLIPLHPKARIPLHLFGTACQRPELEKTIIRNGSEIKRSANLHKHIDARKAGFYKGINLDKIPCHLRLACGLCGTYLRDGSSYIQELFEYLSDSSQLLSLKRPTIFFCPENG